MKKNILTLLIMFLLSFGYSYCIIDVINLGTINYKNKIIGQNNSDTEKLNYNQVKSKIVSVLKANKIQSKVKNGLIESNWLKNNDKANKLFITILADESYIRIQLHQKKLDESIMGNIDPYKIKSEIEKVLK